MRRDERPNFIDIDWLFEAPIIAKIYLKVINQNVVQYAQYLFDKLA